MTKANGGYIKLSRNLLNWRWSENPNTFTVFVHLLLMANYKDAEFMGKKLKRGSLATSYASLGNACGLTYSQGRQAVKRLSTTGEITVKQQARWLEITIVNYDSYQNDDRQMTGKSQANDNHFDRQMTTRERKKEYVLKEGKKEKKEKVASLPDSPSGEPPILPGDRDPAHDYPFPCGLYRKPEWMDDGEWITAREMTADNIPGQHRGDYDSVIEYLHDKKLGCLK